MDLPSFIISIVIVYQFALFIAKPRAGINFICFVIGLTPLLTLVKTFSIGGFAFNYAGIWYISLGIAACLSVLRYLRKVARNPNFKKVIFLILFFLVLIVHSKAPGYAIRYWTHLLVDLSFYLLVSGILISKEDISRVFKWIALSGIIPAAFAIHGFVFKTNIYALPPGVVPGSIFRASGTFLNTSDLAIYMAFIIPVQFLPIVVKRYTAVRTGMLVLYLACSMSFASLILSFTRAPFVILVLTLALVLSFQGLLPKLKMLFLGLLLGGLLAFMIPYSLSQMARIGEDTVASRLANWDLAVSNINFTSLLIGKGLESFRAMRTGGQIHNDYLKLLLETGIFGLAFYVVVISKEFFGQIRLFFRLRRDVSSTDFLFSSILIACFVEYILLSCFDPLFCAGPISTVFWIIAGCNRAFLRLSREESVTSIPK